MGMSEPHTQNKKRVIKRVEEQTFTPSNPSLVIKNLLPNLHIHVPIGAKQKSELQNFVLEGHPIGRVLETPSTGRTSLLVRSFQKKNKNAT